MMLERWEPEAAPEELRRKPFVTMDPGRTGALLAWDERAHFLGYAPAIDPSAAARLCQGMPIMSGQLVFIVETQFVNHPAQARSALEVAFTGGITVGYIGAELKGVQFDLIEVVPSSWQALQHRLAGVKRVKGSGQEVAFTRAERLFPHRTTWDGCTKGLKTGIASAYGIAEWWVDTWALPPGDALRVAA